MRREGEALRREGIAFHDLTLIFLEHPEPLYEDTCCHYNALGNRILSRHVATILLEELGDDLAVPAGNGNRDER